MEGGTSNVQHRGSAPGGGKNSRDVWLNFQLHHLGLVDAEWLFVEEVSGCRESPRPATHADVAELAAAALSFQVVGSAQLLEYFRVLPYVGKVLRAQVTRNNRQISTGIDFSFVGNEANTRSR